MQFTETVRTGRFLKRYKRFFADVQLDEGVVVAHVPNTGSLRSCLFENAACIVTESANPERKLRATLHFVQAPTSWVGVNTSWPNALVWEARERLWPQFGWAQREYKLSKETRLDLVLGVSSPEHFVEVKNVTLADGDLALFPDAETTRGQKHLRELIALKAAGHGAEIVFVIQRQDCARFAPAETIDPEYGRLLRVARSAGVTVRAFACEIEPQKGVHLGQELELAF
jgi:sugar fermentation stimulation protein A